MFDFSTPLHRAGTASRRSRVLEAVVCAFWVSFAVPAWPAPTSAIQASRSSGVAPLAVLFDATATTDPRFPRPFHSLAYEWTFGDPQSGTWVHSGQSRDRASGAVAGHLFTRPGVYRVSLTVTNPDGERTTATTDLSVTSPDQFFSAANTYCYADHTDHPESWSGCPRPCPSPNCINTSDATQAVARRLLPNTRHYFRRGDDFIQTWPMQGDRPGPVLIAASGSGAKPVFTSNFPNPTISAISPSSDWRVGELTLVGSAGVPFWADARVPSIDRFTAWDVDARGFSACASFWGTGPFHTNVALVDFRCTDPSPTTPGRAWLLFERSEGSMYLGLEIEGTSLSNGLFRTVHMTRSVLQHSRLDVGASDGAISIRSCQQTGPSGCGAGVPNQFIVVSDNRIASGNGATIRTCTHESCNPGGANGNDSEDILWERNFLTVDPSDSTPLNMLFWIQGGDQTIRNNVIDVTGAPSATSLHVVVAHGGPSDKGRSNRDNLHVYNNTVFANGPLKGIKVCSTLPQGSGHRCRSNLLFAPGAAEKVAADPPWLASNNLRDAAEYGGFPFATPYRGHNQSRMDDFQLAAGSAAIDAGFDFRGSTLENVAADAFLGCRPAGAGWDVGADEFAASPCGTKAALSAAPIPVP